MEDRWFPSVSTRAESRSSDAHCVRRERLLEPGIYTITLLNRFAQCVHLVWRDLCYTDFVFARIRINLRVPSGRPSSFSFKVGSSAV